jgi:hypothetical protein
MTAIARAVPRRGDSMTTVHNSNSRKRKAPVPAGASRKVSHHVLYKRTHLRAL